MGNTVPPAPPLRSEEWECSTPVPEFPGEQPAGAPSRNGLENAPLSGLPSLGCLPHPFPTGAPFSSCINDLCWSPHLTSASGETQTEAWGNSNTW